MIDLWLYILLYILGYLMMWDYMSYLVNEFGPWIGSVYNMLLLCLLSFSCILLSLPSYYCIIVGALFYSGVGLCYGLSKGGK